MMENSREHIDITDGICGGRPRIAGTRVRVQDIVIRHEQWGMTPDEIVETFSGLTLADIYAALAYYHDHVDRIRSDLDVDARRIADLESKGPPIGEKIRTR
jgi:uncharacterized protein (DUF433 family)